MSVPQLNINYFLNLLGENRDFKTYCLEKFSEMRSDIISFTENPNCGCKKRLVEYLNKNMLDERVLQTIEDWKGKYPNIVISSENQNKNEEEQQKVYKQPKIMIGHIIEIPASPLEYKKFIEMSNKEQWVFRGISVLEKETEKGKVWYLFLF